MKKLIIIIVVLLIMSCQKITVLEVAVVHSETQSVYKVTYSTEEPLEPSWVTYEYFYTLLGVENFLNEVANKDLSQWRTK